jgi:hypothetical protein
LTAKIPWVLAPLYLLNLIFAWTSHVLSNLPDVLWELLVSPLILVVRFTALSLGGINYAYPMIDGLALLCLLLSLWGLRGYFGAKKAGLFLSLNVVAFELEILTFDYGEFWIHATGAQSVYHFAKWFTNADLFVVALVSSGVFAVWAYRPGWLRGPSRLWVRSQPSPSP